MLTNATKKIKSAPKTLFIIVIFILFIFAIYFFNNNYTNNNVKTDINGIEYSLELVDINTTRTQGLSGRQSLGQNNGMLFDFKKDDNWQIWMKDMNFAIDILWLNNKKQIIAIKNNVLPQNFPETYGADQKSRYVIELPAGTANNQNIKIGDTLSW